MGGPLRDLADELLRGALARLRPPSGRCAPRPPPPPPPPPPGSFAWNGSTLLALLDAAQARAGPAGLNGLVRVLTGGAGAAAVPAGALPALRRNLSGLGELVISVGELNVSGLDSLAAGTRLLEPVPSDSAALGSAVQLARLNVSFELHAALEDGASGARAATAVRVSLALRDIALEAKGRLALDLAGLERLQLRQLRLNCTGRQLLAARTLTLILTLILTLTLTLILTLTLTLTLTLARSVARRRRSPR